jgi:hypothetical protein
LSKAQESAAKLLCQCWSFPVKWKLTAKPTVISSQNGEITMRVSYSICIQQSVDKIASLINEAIKQIRIIALDGNMLFTSPFEILRWAQNSLKKIHNAFPNTEIEKMFSDLLGDNFGAKFVYFDSDYATNEYFDFFESNSIEIPKTTVPAIVLQSNKECLLKGTHLIPIQYP